MPRLIFLLTIFFAVCARADDITSKHRLVGLSTPERLDDLRQTMDAVTGVHLVSLDADNAEVTLRYDMEVLFPKYPPKKPKPTAEEIEKRLNEVIGAECKRTFSLRPVSTVPKDRLVKMEFNVGLLDCKACRYAAYIAVAPLDGVERAAVDVKTNVLSAWIDAAKTNREELEKAIRKARIEIVGK